MLSSDQRQENDINDALNVVSDEIVALKEKIENWEKNFQIEPYKSGIPTEMSDQIPKFKSALALKEQFHRNLSEQLNRLKEETQKRVEALTILTDAIIEIKTFIEEDNELAALNEAKKIPTANIGAAQQEVINLKNNIIRLLTPNANNNNEHIQKDVTDSVTNSIDTLIKIINENKDTNYAGYETKTLIDGLRRYRRLIELKQTPALPAKDIRSPVPPLPSSAPPSAPPSPPISSFPEPLNQEFVVLESAPAPVDELPTPGTAPAPLSNDAPPPPVNAVAPPMAPAQQIDQLRIAYSSKLTELDSLTALVSMELKSQHPVNRRDIKFDDAIKTVHNIARVLKNAHEASALKHDPDGLESKIKNLIKVLNDNNANDFSRRPKLLEFRKICSELIENLRKQKDQKIVTTYAVATETVQMKTNSDNDYMLAYKAAVDHAQPAQPVSSISAARGSIHQIKSLDLQISTFGTGDNSAQFTERLTSNGNFRSELMRLPVHLDPVKVWDKIYQSTFSTFSNFISETDFKNLFIRLGDDIKADRIVEKLGILIPDMPKSELKTIAKLIYGEYEKNCKVHQDYDAGRVFSGTRIPSDELINIAVLQIKSFHEKNPGEEMSFESMRAPKEYAQALMLCDAYLKLNSQYPANCKISEEQKKAFNKLVTSPENKQVFTELTKLKDVISAEKMVVNNRGLRL